jgi:hypothetical protein
MYEASRNLTSARAFRRDRNILDIQLTFTDSSIKVKFVTGLQFYLVIRHETWRFGMLLLCNCNYEGDDYFVNGNFISLCVVSSSISYDLFTLQITNR